MATSLSYGAYFQRATEVAIDAGKKIRPAFYSEKVITSKEGHVDLVTETDKEVERFVISSLRESFPDHLFLGEETHSGESEAVADNPTWVIDPIDGTTNFIHRFPFLCISIALCINKAVVLGVVYNPVLEEMFTAVKGEGAFLNGRPISISSASHVYEAVVCTNVGYDRTPQGTTFMLGMLHTLLSQKVQSIRMGGSAALDMCNVACGRVDAFYEFGIHVWDIAAGSLIVCEAGGIVLDPVHSRDDITCRRVIACNKILANELIPLLRETHIPLHRLTLTEQQELNK